MAKKSAGRPTKYSPSILAKTRKYIEECGNEFYDYLKSDGAQSSSWEQKVRVKLPTMEGLALYLGVRRSTIYEWKKNHPTFSDSLEDLVEKQKEMLIAGGLAGYYTPLITKLILSSNHGMSERTDVTSGDEPVTSVKINVVHGAESYNQHSAGEKLSE